MLNVTQLPVREEEKLPNKKETNGEQPKQASALQCDDQPPPYASDPAKPVCAKIRTVQRCDTR